VDEKAGGTEALLATIAEKKRHFSLKKGFT
jgi:hypothetical protein